MTYTPEPNDDELRDSDGLDDSFPEEAPIRRKRRRRKKSVFNKLRKQIGVKRFKTSGIVIALIAVVIIIGVGGFALFFDSANRVQASLRGLQRVVSSVSGRSGTDLTLADFERLQRSINDLQSSLNDTLGRLQLIAPLRDTHNALRTSFHGVQAASHLARAANSMLRGLQPALFFLVEGESNQTVVAQFTSSERLVELLDFANQQFINADEQLVLAQQELDQLSYENIPFELIREIDQLTLYRDLLTNVNQIMLDAPALLTGALGLNGSKTYLVLAQNNDELRPSGGFVGTYGWFRINDGRILDYEYSASTRTSPNPPSADFLNDFEIPSWWLQYRQPVYAAWDGGWSPDFPTTARWAMNYYNEGGNPHAPLDGVLAIDVDGFEYLLGAIGQVSIPEYNTTIDRGNFRRVIYDIRAFYNASIPHKDFLVIVYQRIFEEWQRASGNPQKNALILGAFLRGLQEKHIMLYFNDDRLNQAISLLGWAGEQLPITNEDYLMVVDANLGNKSNNSIARGLTYDVRIADDGSLNNRLSVVYDYAASRAALDPAVDPEHHGRIDYGNLMQVFVAHNSQLISTNFETSQSTTVVEHPNTTAFVSTVLVPYDTSQRFQFTYTTPPLIEQVGSFRRYRLNLQKQPGMEQELVSIQVVLPRGARFVSSSPEPAARFELDGIVLEYRLNLTADQRLEIIYQTN